MVDGQVVAYSSILLAQTISEHVAAHMFFFPGAWYDPAEPFQFVDLEVLVTR